MTQKSSLKVILEDAEKGCFHSVLLKLEKNEISLDTTSSIRLVIACCVACSKHMNTPSEISEVHLEQLLSILVNAINVPKDAYFDNYISSAFFIVKLLLCKDSVECVLTLENFLVPRFIPDTLNQKQISTYKSIGATLFDYIARKVQSDSYEKEILLDTCILLTKLWKLCLERNKFLDNCYHCMRYLQLINTDHNKLNKFYFHVLHSLRGCSSNSKNEDQFASFVNFFHLHFITYLKLGNFMEGHTCFNETLLFMSNYFEGDQYVNLCNLLDFISLVCSTEVNNKQKKLNQCYNSLKKYYGKHNVDKLKPICSMVSSTVAILVYHYKSVDKTKWIELSVDEQLEIFNYCQCISEIFMKIPFSCSCKKCDINICLYDAAKLIGTIVSLGKLTISYTDKVLPIYRDKLVCLIESAFVCILKLKEKGCDKWKMCWHEIAINLYNMCIACYKIDTNSALIYVNILLKYLLKFEGVKPEIVNENVLYASLTLLTEISFKSKDFKKCLVITALIIMLFPNNRESEINRWIKVKVTLKDSNDAQLQAVTISSVLEKYSSFVTQYIPDFSLNNKQITELLIYELEQYKEKWRSKIPMLSAFKELCKVSDPLSLAQTTVQTWYNFTSTVHEDVPQLIQIVISKYESYLNKCKNVEGKQIYLAYLYYLHYRFRLKQSVYKNYIDMEKTMTFSKIQEDKNDVPRDPNDECDIVSSYEALKIDRHATVTKSLCKSLVLLSLIIQGENCTGQFGVFGVNEVFTLLTDIAYEYRLQMHILYYTQVSELAFKLADMQDDKSLILKAISCLIEFSDVSKDAIKCLITRADTLVPQIKYTSNEHLKTIIAYYICRSSAYIHTNVPESVSSFKKATSYFKLWQGKEDLILRARYCLLHAKLIALPCEFNIEDHKEYSLVKIHLALAHVVSHVNKGSGTESAYDMSVVFEVKDALIKMVHLLQLPREVRCYAKDTVLLAQKLLLPLRTSSLLIYLAHADLLSCRLDDCKVKINGLSDILCLSRYKMNITPQKDAEKTCEKVDFNEAVDAVTYGMQEVMLDLPPVRFKQSSPGSPLLMLQPFKLPQFINHTKLCTCFCCNCLEYQRCVIAKLHLEALVNVHQDNIALAQDYFFGGIKIYEYLCSNSDNYKNRANKLIHNDLTMEPKRVLFEPYCYILLDYVNSLLKLKNNKNSKSINKKLIDLLKPVYLEYVYLYNEALMQKLDLKFETPPDNSHKDTLKVEEPEGVDMSRTPESKHSKVRFLVTCSPDYLSVPHRQTKTVLFNLTDNDETQTVMKKENHAQTIKGSKTPAPTKIKIYTPAALNTTKKKKKSCLDILSPNSDECTLAANNAFFLSNSPLKSLQDRVPEKVPAGLQSRTKLLTEKLKYNDKKVGKPNKYYDENAISNGKSSHPTRNSVRKNLLSDLTKTKPETTKTTEKCSGAVRRSARPKK